MNLLLLHSSSDLYGASKIFLQTVLVLQENGHQCQVVLSAPGPLADALLAQNIPVHICSLGIIRRKYFHLNGVFNRIQKWKGATRFLSNLIREEKIDMVYSNTAAVLIGGYVARKHKLKHIWHIHEIIEKPKFLHSIISWCMQRWSDKIIVVSKAVFDHWPAAGNKRVLLYNGVAPLEKASTQNLRSVYGIPATATVIGMAGRIHYWKGQGYFLDIAEALIPQHQELYFLLAGDAFPGYEYLEAQILDRVATSPLKGRVFFMGYCGDMSAFYEAIDVFMLPSQQPDPLPTVVLEAMGAGKLVIATEQGGALEMVVDQETGFFIPIQDVVRAAEKINRYLQDANREEMGNKAKHRVEAHFSPQAFEQHLLNIIGSV